MPISKRLRYEILRRDNHTCRYCGGTAPDVKLTVDHVLPIALGGTDTADNCVTACADCNAGKSSSSPTQPLVEQVQSDAFRWAAAIRSAADLAESDRLAGYDYMMAVEDAWDAYCELPRYKQNYGTHFPRPDHWPDDVERLRKRNMPLPVVEECVRITARAKDVYADDRWRYFMGCCWRRLAEIEQRAKEIFFAAGREGDE